MGRAHAGAGLRPVADGGTASGASTAPSGPASWPPAARWPAALHRAVRALAAATHGRSLPLVALSGGADSLALAVTAAEAMRTGASPELAGGVGAVVVDHGLLPGSAGVADRAATVARALSLNPVTVERVEISATGDGPEADARTARHAALESAARRLGSDAVLLAHTRDDQAEQVLLGLARGSGTRTIAGMPRSRGLLLRPVLELTRRDTEAICHWAGLLWWEDPSNVDPAFLRSRIRTRLLPALEDSQQGLGPGLSAALARSADIAAEDAAALEDWAAREFERLGTAAEAPGLRPASGPESLSVPLSVPLSLPLDELAALPDAIRYRVLGLAVVAAGGERPSRERVLAVDRLVSTRSTGGSSAGPVELAGGVVSHRRRVDGYARLVFSAVRP